MEAVLLQHTLEKEVEEAVKVANSKEQLVTELREEIFRLTREVIEGEKREENLKAHIQNVSDQLKQRR